MKIAIVLVLTLIFVLVFNYLLGANTKPTLSAKKIPSNKQKTINYHRSNDPTILVADSTDIVPPSYSGRFYQESEYSYSNIGESGNNNSDSTCDTGINYSSNSSSSDSSCD
jgi:hypothetical protein